MNLNTLLKHYATFDSILSLNRQQQPHSAASRDA
jgi:hypothetical protein